MDHQMQASQYFLISGRKTRVSLSSAGLVLDLPQSGWRNHKSTVIPLSKIVTTECKKSHKTCVGRHWLVKTIKLSTCSFGLAKHGYRTFGSAGHDVNVDVTESLVVHYVKEQGKKGLIRLKQIILNHTGYDVIRKWSDAIKNYSNQVSRRPKKLLVFINPFGGRGNARNLWERKILPIFQMAEIRCQVIVTKHANHAFSLLQTLPFHGHDGVISVGGDGMFAEVFNGVTIRAARDATLDVDDKATEFVRPGIRVGFIPGGSTDSISMCLHGTTDPVTAALHIVLGDSMLVDAVAIHSAERLERLAMTMVSYGYFGDLMTHSEKYRWLGRSRYSLSGVRTFLANKSYPGKVSYVADDADQSGLLGAECGEGCHTCSQQVQGQGREMVQDESKGGINNSGVREFEVVGRFLGVTSATLSCSCRHTVPGLSPSAHTGDGTTDLIIVHNTFHLNYLRYLFRTAFNMSHPFRLPFVQAVRVKSWSFTPQGDELQSAWNCDGEVLENVKIFVKCHRQLVPVFARGVYNKIYQAERKLAEEAQLFDDIPAL